MGKKWYAIHSQSGHEAKVKANLGHRVEAAGMQKYVSRILVPTEEVAEVRGRKKKISTRTTFPGYLLMEVELAEGVENLIRTTPGVTGFVGAGRRPVPLDQSEVDDILKSAEEKKAKPKPSLELVRGDTIRIIDGPFVNFNGTVDESYPEKGKLKAMISIFGRSTPVELEYWQAEKS